VLYGTVRRPPPLATTGRSASWTVRQISGLRHIGEYETDTLTPRTRPKRHYRFWTIAVAVRYAARRIAVEAEHGADTHMGTRFRTLG